MIFPIFPKICHDILDFYHDFCGPIPIRIMFKTAVLVYKCQHGTAPQYLQAYCEQMSAHSSRRLQSASSSLLAVPRTRTNYGDRGFAVHGPRVWNSLPDELRSPDITLTTFRNKLKTLLFDVNCCLQRICGILRKCAL